MALVCAIDGALHLFDCADGSLRAITGEDARQTDLNVSGTGRYLSYVRAGELYLHDLTESREERLTYDASDTVSNGRAEFIAQEEMHRFDGHWWSPDDRHLVFARVDEAPIPITYRYEFTARALVAVAQRYPYSGAANAIVTLGVIDLAARSVRWIDLRIQPGDYLARVNVANDRVVVQTQSRDQRTVTVTSHPFDGGAMRTLWVERQTRWVNLHDNFRFVGEDAFLWTSEREGSSRLYLHRGDAPPVALTPAVGRVNDVVHADATHTMFVGWTDSPIEQHLYRVAYAEPGVLRRLTHDDGWHEATIDSSGRRFLDRFSNVARPPRLELCSIESADSRQTIVANELTEGHPYFEYLGGHSEPTFGRIPAADGQTLFYRLTLPRGGGAGRRWPVLVSVYGGPGVQRVRNEWAPLTHQLFTLAGIAVFELDNRGGGNREKRFEDPIAGELARVEVEDQIAGIDWLARQPWADSSRIGVMGHSYGGYMALMLHRTRRRAFAAGVSSAPVTDWRLYDTHYTERYLGTPEANPDGYRISAVLSLRRSNTRRAAADARHGRRQRLVAQYDRADEGAADPPFRLRADAVSRRQARTAGARQCDPPLSDDAGFPASGALTVTYQSGPQHRADIELLADFNHAMAKESEDKPLDLAGLKQVSPRCSICPADGYYLIAEDRTGAPSAH